MSSDLTVGRLDELFVSDVEEILERIDASDRISAWMTCPEEVAVISLMNVSSVSFFNQFAARLEGLTGHDAMDRSQFKNLPWWLDSVWLPLDINPPIVSNTGDPVFVGSVAGLKSDLLKIQRMVPDLMLGTVPTEYEAMRRDYRAWWKSVLESHDDTACSDDDTVRWIWRALYDGAEIAEKNDAPVFWYGG